MKFRSYNGEIRTATAQTLDVFNDITIDRRNVNGVQKLIHVPCVYGNRSRILKSLENKNKTLKIPLMVITKQSITRDTMRVADTNNGLLFQIGASDGYDVLKNRPQPMNIDFELSIITKYEDDMDQIISNFIPMMSPDVYVVWPNPKQIGKNLKSQLVWDGSINYESPTDVAETDPYRVIVTTNLTYKTWIFPGLERDLDDGPLIHKINFCPNLLSIGDGNYGLDRWYDVQMGMSIDDYQERVVCGLIKKDRTRPNWDWLPCSISGQVSGYPPSGSNWPPLSTIINECCPSGCTIPSGDINKMEYTFDENGNLIILGESI
jgi:hypothetical protein